MKVRSFGCIVLLFCSPLDASDFTIEKQKPKISLEYQNFIDFNGNEISTSGLEATYLFKAKADIRKLVFLNVDYQTGIQANFDRHSVYGELPPWTWSNRLTTTVTVPVKKLYFGGTFFFRNNLLGDVPEGAEFLDIFGGEQFHEISGSVQSGFVFTPQWEVSVSAQKSSLRFTDFPLSNSDSKGASARLSRRISKVRFNFGYRVQSIDFQRPIFFVPVNQPGDVFFPTDGGDFLLQHDYFQEIGAGAEFFHSIYFSAGYAYQNNQSNNPGFSFHNNRLSFLVGTELAPSLYLQAYAIASLLDFLQEDADLPFPLVPNQNDSSTMAASITKAFKDWQELELGFQRLTYNSSFVELKTSKYIVYLAYNLRF